MKLLKDATLLAVTFLPSTLRLAIWRMLGFEVGRGCQVAMFSIVVADRIELGPGAVIEALTLIYRPNLLRLGERARIAGFVRIIGHEGVVCLKPQSFVGLGCLIDSTAGFELGDRSQMGPRSTAYSHGGSHLSFNMGYPFRIGPIRIGSDSWIGMACILHPGAKVGDRVIVLPGLAIRGEVADDTSLVGLQPEHRVVSTKRLLLGVPEGEKQARIDELLKRLSAEFGGSRLDVRDHDVWLLELGDGSLIHLLRRPGLRVDPDKLGAQSMIWSLSRDGIVAGSTSFCFERLTVYGPWTPIAEKVAAFLCRAGGQFIFEDRFPGTHGSGKA